MAARQCHQMPLIEIYLNMDMLHSDIDNGYKQQDEALPDLNVDAADLYHIVKNAS